MNKPNLFNEVKSIIYKDDRLFFLDQTKLPIEKEMLEIKNIEDCWDAIKRLVVRGAPAIGIGAAYGLYIAARDIEDDSFEGFYKEFKVAKDYLATSRPTAVNLFWALNKMDDKVLELREKPVGEIKKALEQQAIDIQKEDEEVCRKIGEFGQEIIKEGMGILTHCNAGALATSKYGTALAPMYVAKENGIAVRVFADETRPLLQGSRLTAYELKESGIDVTLITDSMAATVMARGLVQAVIVGCDRVAANGDAANKIGTYGVALLAKAHNIPFYVAGPLSTFDLDTPTGEDIPIEERDSEEIICGMGKQTAPEDVNVFNPAFDVTPSELIAGIITERGIIRSPFSENIKAAFEQEM